MDDSAPLQNLFVTVECHLCGSYEEVNIRRWIRCANRKSQPRSQQNQLFDVVAGVEEAAGADEPEVPVEAAGVELSDDFGVSLAGLASLLPFAEAGLAEE